MQYVLDISTPVDFLTGDVISFLDSGRSVFQDQNFTKAGKFLTEVELN